MLVQHLCHQQAVACCATLPVARTCFAWVLPCVTGRVRISPGAVNVNTGIQIHKRNQEVLIQETKFSRCVNGGSCVFIRAWWRRVSVPPSLGPGWTNMFFTRAVEVLTSRAGDRLQRQCSCVGVWGARIQGLRWEVREESSNHVAEIERLEGAALDG